MRAALTHPFLVFNSTGVSNDVAANMRIRAGSGRLEFRAYAASCNENCVRAVN